MYCADTTSTRRPTKPNLLHFYQRWEAVSGVAQRQCPFAHHKNDPPNPKPHGQGRAANPLKRYDIPKQDTLDSRLSSSHRHHDNQKQSPDNPSITPAISQQRNGTTDQCITERGSLTLRQACSLENQQAQCAFKVLMIREVLQFALRIAFRCVLHRCGNLDIHC